MTRKTAIRALVHTMQTDVERLAREVEDLRRRTGAAREMIDDNDGVTFKLLPVLSADRVFQAAMRLMRDETRYDMLIDTPLED